MYIMLNNRYRQSRPGARQPGPMRLLGLLAALVLGTPAAPLLAAGASGQPKLSGTVRAAHASAVHGATVYATELRTGIIVSKNSEKNAPLLNVMKEARLLPAIFSCFDRNAATVKISQ